MGRLLRRIRGVLLRLALAPRASIITGVLLAAPALVLMFGEYRWESWLTDGLALVLGASGAALVFAGVGGRRGDWVDPG